MLYGAGIVVSNHSTIKFSENSVVTFNQNTANNSGGAILLNYFSSAVFEANCVVTFNNNIANQYYGGSIFSYNNSNVVLKGNSSVQFNKNMGKYGGVLYIKTNSTFAIEENSSVIFNSNEADLGGAIYTDNSDVLFKINSFPAFNDNVHDSTISFYSTNVFTNKSRIAVFINNRAIQGGAIYLTNESILQFKETSSVTFIHNEGENFGGALSCQNSSKVLLKRNHILYLLTIKLSLGELYTWKITQLSHLKAIL